MSLVGIMPVGASATIILSAPQLWDPLELAGVVVWARHAAQQEEVGVRFEDPSGANLGALAALLEAVLFA